MLRSNISKSEIAQFCEDFNMLIEEGFTKSECYEILRILESRRQTASLELLKRTMTHSFSENPPFSE